MTKLQDRHCVPCEGNLPPLKRPESLELTEQIDNWELIEDKAIEKVLIFKDFNSAVSFINRVAEIAEKEGHHPDISLFGWKKVRLTISTHAIKGLSENDFILASKIDQLQKQ